VIGGNEHAAHGRVDQLVSFVGLLLVPLVGNAGDGGAENKKRRGLGIEEVLRGHGTRSFLRGVKSHYTRMGRVGLREEMLKPHVGGAGVPAFCQTGKNAILNQHG